LDQVTNKQNFLIYKKAKYIKTILLKQKQTFMVTIVAQITFHISSHSLLLNMPCS